MSNEEQLRNELEKLRKEVAELRGGAGASKRYTVTEGEYKGHPVLSFDGPGLRTPLTLGLSKLRAIEAGWQQAARFLAKNPPSSADGPSQQDDDRI